MENSEDFDVAVADAVGENIGRSSQDELAGSVTPARPTDVWMACEHGGTLLDQIYERGCCRPAISRDVRKYLIELTQRALRPD